MKKRFAVITALFMAFVSAAAAEGEPKVILNGFYEAHNKVRVKTENIENIKNVIWYVDGEEKAQGEEYIISDYDSGCDLKAIVIDEENNEYESNIKTIENTLKKKEDAFEFSSEQDKSAYEFTSDGEEFLMLDSTEDDNSKFLIVKKESIGTRSFNKMTTFSQGNTAQHFYDMSAFLNNESAGYGYIMDDTLEVMDCAEDYTLSGYKGDESYIQIPEIIYEHINKEHVWKCEPVKIGQAYEYCVKAGIVLPSAADVRKYPFAFYDVSDTWLRTARGINLGNGKEVLFLDGGKVSYDEYTSEKKIMPQFYIDRDFFLENKISQVGNEAMKMISRNYSMEELLTLYSEEELKNLGYKNYLIDSAEVDSNGGLIINMQSNATEEEKLYIMVLSYDENDMLIGASCSNIQPIFGKNEITMPICEEYFKITVMLTDGSLTPKIPCLNIQK